jgi:hypothetical protein
MTRLVNGLDAINFGSERLTEINDELDDLESCDPLLPPDADATCTLEVVPVHDNVNKQVDGDGHPLHGSATKELGVAKDSGSAMVVAVKEGYRVSKISKAVKQQRWEAWSWRTHSVASS